MHQFANLRHLLQISFHVFLVGTGKWKNYPNHSLFLRPLKSSNLNAIYLTKIFCKQLIRNWSPTFNVPLLLIGFAGHRRVISMFSPSVSKCIHVKNYKMTKMLLQSTQLTFFPHSFTSWREIQCPRKKVRPLSSCIKHWLIVCYFHQIIVQWKFWMECDSNLMDFNA